LQSKVEIIKCSFCKRKLITDTFEYAVIKISGVTLFPEGYFSEVKLYTCKFCGARYYLLNGDICCERKPVVKNYEKVS